MGRRVVELTAEELDLLPERCQHCLFWELGTARPIERLGSTHDHHDELAADPLTQKCAWWRGMELEWGSPGRFVRVDGEGVGWCLLGDPGAFASRRRPVPPPSSDALLLATIWVEPPFRGAGVGRLLLHAAVKEAIRRERRGVEAYGDRKHRDAACVAPCTWLLHEGFVVHREHPRYPLLRLDVRSVARWTETFEHAVEQARSRLARRELAPAPHRPSVGRG
ncbi:MAG: GNAT family N-acetyltransferase [Actinobacteria bacterium]|nr:GNAT family N-acetyltransferase [Actinomycetota bacterium]